MVASLIVTFILIGVVVVIQKVLPDGSMSGYSPSLSGLARRHHPEDELLLPLQGRAPVGGVQVRNFTGPSTSAGVAARQPSLAPVPVGYSFDSHPVTFDSEPVPSSAVVSP